MAQDKHQIFVTVRFVVDAKSNKRNDWGY